MHHSTNGKNSHQHDVERQHVEVGRLELEDQPLEDRLDRIVVQARDIEFVQQRRLIVALGRPADRRDVDDEQQHVCDIELPDPLQQLHRADDESALEHHLRVDESGGIPGDEHEQVRGIAEAVVPRRHPGDEVVRNVIEVDRPVGNAAKQVEPKIAAGGRKDRVDGAHVNQHRIWICAPTLCVRAEGCQRRGGRIGGRYRFQVKP